MPSTDRKRILVTGAGGSLGRPLVVRLLESGHDVLALDQSEKGLFLLKQLVEEREGILQPILLVQNLSEHPLVQDVFTRNLFDVVVHAAAYKHVGLMEVNEAECRRNNVNCTSDLLELSMSTGVAQFIFLSTDKAVDPQSVMGRTKAEAEALLADNATTDGIAISILRLPNVLGTDGSVVQIFRRQLLLERPLTLTDENATRLFISPSRACDIIETVLNEKLSGTLVPSEVEEISVMELADRAHTLWGNDEDFEVCCIGLGVGERLSESLLGKNERGVKTSCPGLLRIESDGHAH